VLALDAAELGTWRWEAGTKKIQWDGRCRALFGVPPDARVTYETWANSIVAEDRARGEANVARALDPGDILMMKPPASSKSGIPTAACVGYPR
jgi:PAS domain-containing protein